jgi:hypothetical protein
MSTYGRQCIGGFICDVDRWDLAPRFFITAVDITTLITLRRSLISVCYLCCRFKLYHGFQAFVEPLGIEPAQAAALAILKKKGKKKVKEKKDG